MKIKIPFMYRAMLIASFLIVANMTLFASEKLPTEEVFTVALQRPFPVGLPTCLQTAFRDLEKLYDATGGDNWTHKDNWFTNPQMNTWYGITLTTTGCDVQAIKLVRNNLIGTIPNLNFPNLEILALPFNQLTGTLPNFNLPKLEVLGLPENQLTGTIPNFNLPNLAILSLSQNQLTGTIPNFNLPKLKNLMLDKNQLTGTIPNFNLPKLGLLNLAHNRLTGAAPKFNSPSLQVVELGFNQLTDNSNGAFPPPPPPLIEKAPEPEGPNKIYTIVEENPEFSGGKKELDNWFTTNLKYPANWRETGIGGTVYIGFVVEKDGSITDVQLKRGIGNGCNEEAIRLIKSMPKWKPGKENGQVVRVAYTLPIKFKLE